MTEAEEIAYRVIRCVMEGGARAYDKNYGDGKTRDFAGFTLYGLHSGGKWRSAERLTLAGDGWTIQFRQEFYGFGERVPKVYGDKAAFESTMIALKMMDEW